MCTGDSGRTEQFGRNFPSNRDVYDGLRLRSYRLKNSHADLLPIGMAIAD
ncbi:hypothetical protein [Nostoc sp.]